MGAEGAGVEHLRVEEHFAETVAEIEVMGGVLAALFRIIGTKYRV